MAPSDNTATSDTIPVQTSSPNCINMFRKIFYVPVEHEAFPIPEEVGELPEPGNVCD